MLYAIIETEAADPVICELPQSVLYFNLLLKLQGIRISAKELNLTAGKETKMQLKADDELWGNFIRLCRETDTLEEINNAADRFERADREIKHDLNGNMKRGKYTSLNELLGGIEYLKRCIMKFYCPLEVRYVGTDGWEEEYSDSSYLYDSIGSVKKLIRRGFKGESGEFERRDTMRKKLRTAKWGAECLDSEVYCSIIIKLWEPFTDRETEEFKGWIADRNQSRKQMEQKPVRIPCS